VGVDTRASQQFCARFQEHRCFLPDLLHAKPRPGPKI
jgi:hypothetical protein